MTGFDWLEIIGTVAFFVFSTLCAYIALHADRFTRWGQEALLAAAAFLFTAGLMRALVFVGWVEREEAVVVNSLAACSFVIVGLQIAGLRFVYERSRNLDRKEQP